MKGLLTREAWSCWFYNAVRKSREHEEVNGLPRKTFLEQDFFRKNWSVRIMCKLSLYNIKIMLTLIVLIKVLMDVHRPKGLSKDQCS
jgi:hypothetical protein